LRGFDARQSRFWVAICNNRITVENTQLLSQMSAFCQLAVIPGAEGGFSAAGSGARYPLRQAAPNVM
jgi:16S rRNA U1498 N3-methylase RsmE